MSELILLKSPEENFPYKSLGTNMLAERVVGVVEPYSPAVLEYGFADVAHVNEEPIDLGELANAKLADFYSQTLARNPRDWPFYNCHMFACYVLGSVVTLPKGASRMRLAPGSVGADRPDSTTQSGGVYGAFDASMQLSHSVLGTGRPDYNVSVIGDYMPMVVSRNRDIVDFYRASQLRQYQPDKLHVQLPDARPLRKLLDKVVSRA